MTATEIAGFTGAGLAGAAYVPQIAHMVRARCSAGISRLAFAVWLLSSVLITARAIAIGAGVFVVLGGIQIVATTLIMLCAVRYKDTPCPTHASGRLTVEAAAGTGTPGTGLASWCPPVRPTVGSAAPAGHDAALRAPAPVLHPHAPGQQPDQNRPPLPTAPV